MPQIVAGRVKRKRFIYLASQKTTGFPLGSISTLIGYIDMVNKKVLGTFPSGRVQDCLKRKISFDNFDDRA
jgi:hypothetical protein